jgi:hypothetical protein
MGWNAYGGISGDRVSNAGRGRPDEAGWAFVAEVDGPHCACRRGGQPLRAAEAAGLIGSDRPIPVESNPTISARDTHRSDTVLSHGSAHRLTGGEWHPRSPRAVPATHQGRPRPRSRPRTPTTSAPGPLILSASAAAPFARLPLAWRGYSRAGVARLSLSGTGSGSPRRPQRTPRGRVRRRRRQR